MANLFSSPARSGHHYQDQHISGSAKVVNGDVTYLTQDSPYSRCLIDLRLTDPRYDKARIEQTKGSLLEGAYKWILDHPDFRTWRSEEHSRLLWIKGDAGKGKTMLLIGIINEMGKTTRLLKPTFNAGHLLSYFLCQGTDVKLNNATAVLRGLIYLLLIQQESLVSHLQIEYDRAGKNLFEGENVFYTLSQVFQNMLCDSTLPAVYLIIDALDECETGLPQLLDLINQTVSAPRTRVKWIISSRNIPEIEHRLTLDDSDVKLSLELNAEHVSHAIDVYIDHKVSQLTSIKHDQALKGQVQNQMRQKADGTFLWVALVFEELQDVQRYDMLQVIEEVPAGLIPLYDQMMKQVRQRKRRDPEFCRRVLSTATLAYRPLYLLELQILAGIQEEMPHKADLERIINMCASFLTVQKNQVYLIHQSAKDYLSTSAFIFPAGREPVHLDMFSRSLSVMSLTLRKDVYNLQHPGLLIDQVKPNDPGLLFPVRYPCAYWVNHLCEIKISHDEVGLYESGIIDFFLRKHFLHWLEALSLVKGISDGVLAIAKLIDLLTRVSSESQLLHLVQDMHRFILSSRNVIENSPLQAYSSALLFSPVHSLTRELFQDEEPDWITTKPGIEADWGACIQTLYGHSSSVRSVAFSHNGTQVVSGSGDKTIKIWDASSSASLQTLKGHSDSVGSVAFSHNGTQVVSGSWDKTIKIWDAGSSACLQTLEGHSNLVNSVAFSHDGTQVVSGSWDDTIKIWDAGSGACLQTLEGHSNLVNSVAFSHNGTQVVSGSWDKTIKIWDAGSGACLQTLEGHSNLVNSVAFSHDGTQVVSGSWDKTIKIWDASSSACLQTLKGHSDSVGSVAFSHNGTQVVSGSEDKTIKIWDASSGACLQTLEGHSYSVNSVAFSHNGTQVVSGSWDDTIKIWDAGSSACLQTLEGHSDSVNSVAFSHDGTQVVSGSEDKTIKIWDAGSSTCLQTLEGHNNSVGSVAFSHDGIQVVSGSGDKTIKIWDASSGACLQTLEGHSNLVNSVAFSHNGTQVVSGSWDKTIKIWDASSGACLQTLEGHSNLVNSVAFSYDGTQVVSGSADNTIKIWDAGSGACLQTLEGHSNLVNSVAFSYDGTQVVSGSADDTIKIWDAGSGACLKTLNVGRTVYNVAFDTTGSYLLTDRGIISWNVSSNQNIALATTALEESRHHGYGLNADQAWITWNGHNVLWLPSEYRPSCSAVASSTIAIGCPSGRVLVINFSFNKSPLNCSS